MNIKERIKLEQDRVKASWKYGKLWAHYQDLNKYPALLMLRSRQLETLRVSEELLEVYSEMYWIAIRDGNYEAAKGIADIIDSSQVPIWNLKQELDMA